MILYSVCHFHHVHVHIITLQCCFVMFMYFFLIIVLLVFVLCFEVLTADWASSLNKVFIISSSSSTCSSITPVRPWLQNTADKDSTRVSVPLWYHYRSRTYVQQYFHLSWLSIFHIFNNNKDFISRGHSFDHMCASLLKTRNALYQGS